MIPFSVVGRNNYRAYASFFIIVISTLFFGWEIYITSNAGAPIDEMLDSIALMTCSVGEQSLVNTLYTGTRSLFLHDSFSQFVFNMIFFWVFAPLVERFLGHWRFVGFYLLGGFGGHLFSILFSVEECLPLFGPSGAIAAVMAAFLVLYPTKRIGATVSFLGRSFEFPALFFVLAYMGMSVFADSGGPLSGDVSPYWDEIGGFITGLVAIFIINLRKPAPKVDPFDYLDD